MWAARGLFVDIHYAESALGRRTVGWSVAHEQLGHPPCDEPDDQEVQECAKKITHTQPHAADVESRCLPAIGRRERSDERHDEIVHKGGYQLRQRRANYNGKRKRNYILLDQE